MDRIKIGILLALNIPESCVSKEEEMQEAETLDETVADTEEGAEPAERRSPDYILSTCI